jgi:hypothetical protein
MSVLRVNSAAKPAGGDAPVCDVQGFISLSGF